MKTYEHRLRHQQAFLAGQCASPAKRTLLTHNVFSFHDFLCRTSFDKILKSVLIVSHHYTIADHGAREGYIVQFLPWTAT